jgi:acyl-CoA synthetase (AMP-forming)/AMP-acid ligase II
MGARVVLARDGEPDVAGLIERERITHTFLPAATLAALSADAGATTRDFGAVRQVWFGGCTIPRSTLRDCVSLFPDALVHAYGMTEVCGVATVLGTGERLDHRHRLSSVGRPIAGVEVQVRDPNTGAPLPSGRPGEVWVRTAHLMAGYWRDPEATEAAITEGGWYRTGDGGLLDAHGYLYLTDRIQDRIISGGRYVYPSEVERILAELPSVAELAVIGVPDESWGEVPKALVVAAEGHTVDEAALLAHCRRYLAKEKCPRSVDVVDHLPRNATGRITKKDLYPRYWPHPD